MIALHDGGNVVIQADGPEEAIRTDLRMAQHPPCWSRFRRGFLHARARAMRARVFGVFSGFLIIRFDFLPFGGYIVVFIPSVISAENAPST